MNWTRIGLGLSSILSLILVIRLVKLNLHQVYRVFSFFLVFEVLSDWLAGFEKLLELFSLHPDYRITWLATRLLAWVLDLWMVYALLQAILANLTGILRLYKRVLTFTLPVVVIAALLSARPEYFASGSTGYTLKIERAIAVGLVLERVISTVALLVLLLMLFFILWFPVKMPRNLAIFSTGYVFYFTVKTSLLLLRSYWAHSSFEVVDTGVSFVLSACFLYLILFLNQRGETVPVTLGHRWSTSDQPRLLGSLESLNTALVRAARR